jgi:hypothetical protein
MNVQGYAVILAIAATLTGPFIPLHDFEPLFLPPTILVRIRPIAFLFHESTPCVLLFFRGSHALLLYPSFHAWVIYFHVIGNREIT